MRVWILITGAVLVACSGGTEPGQGDRLLVASTADTLRVDSIAQLHAFVREGGDSVDVPGVVWSSRNPDIASVTEDGIVTGHASGIVTLVGLAGDLRGTTNLRVERRFKAMDVATGSASLCAVDLNGQIWCTAGFGTGASAPGAAPEDIRAFVVPVAGPERYRLVGTNQFFACGLDSGGHLHCWGYSYLGREISSGIPMPVDPGRTYDTLSVQGWAACGLSAQTAHCWGVPYDSVRNVNFGAGQLVRVEVGDFEACGYTADGNNQCWDEYSYNYARRAVAQSVVGTPLSTGRAAPPLHGGVTGAGFYCGLDAAGAAWCWGSNDDGQLGDGTARASDEPVAVAGGPHFTRLAAAVAGGIHRVCGIADTDELFCWGAGFGPVPAAVLY
jgi:hypothetical protein